VDDNGRQVSKAVSLAFGAGIHPAFMAPMAIAALATLAGMFMILDSRAADQRLVLAGQRTGPLLAGRLTLIALAAAAATGGSLAVTATSTSRAIGPPGPAHERRPRPPGRSPSRRDAERDCARHVALRAASAMRA